MTVSVHGAKVGLQCVIVVFADYTHLILFQMTSVTCAGDTLCNMKQIRINLVSASATALLLTEIEWQFFATCHFRGPALRVCSLLINACIRKPLKGTLTNSEYPDETQHSAAFYQGLLVLLRKNLSSTKVFFYN